MFFIVPAFTTPFSQQTGGRQTTAYSLSALVLFKGRQEVVGLAVAGQVVICPMMYVALTYDHRIVDGKEAVLFLRRVKDVIENPAPMLLEI